MSFDVHKKLYLTESPRNVLNLNKSFRPILDFSKFAQYSVSKDKLKSRFKSCKDIAWFLNDFSIILHFLQYVLHSPILHRSLVLSYIYFLSLTAVDENGMISSIKTHWSSVNCIYRPCIHSLAHTVQWSTLSPVTSQSEGRGNCSHHLPLRVELPSVPRDRVGCLQSRGMFRVYESQTAKSKLAVGVSVGGCLSRFPVMNWQRVNAVPPLHPKTSGMESSTPATLSAAVVAAMAETGSDASSCQTHDWARKEQRAGAVDLNLEEVGHRLTR